MPNARPQWRCQAPQPRSGAPKAQGLIAALWSQHNPACRRSLQTAAPTQTTFTGAVALMATSAPAVKLHLLDGRDPNDHEIVFNCSVRCAAGFWQSGLGASTTTGDVVFKCERGHYWECNDN